MSESRENPETAEKKCTLKKNKHGRLVISGPKFTKEDIARDFPEDSDRDAIIIRRSVGL